MNAFCHYFSTSYRQAREKFLHATQSMHQQALIHPLPGRDGEPLALDVAFAGEPNWQDILILSSGCHGVEGYCGSGVQLATLDDAAVRDLAQRHQVGILYLHALNPHGFSWQRRVTHENVDLNRNFQDFSQALPQNPAYASLHPVLLPETWPPSEANLAAIHDYITHHGMAAFQAAVSGGQYDFADGLFYGGQAPTWSHHTVRQILRQYCGQARRVAWIDLHTGLGPNGVGERIFGCRDDAPARARAERWWNPHGTTPITSVHDGSSTSAPVTGLITHALYQECPQAEFTSIFMEYGTQSLQQVLRALRADHWLHLHPGCAPELAQAIHQQMMDAFYTDTPEWRSRIVAQAREAIFQAIRGLGTV